MSLIPYITFSFTGNSQTSGPFYPRAKYAFNVSISGTFVGTVGLYRQLPGDSTSTWRLVNQWTAPVETSVLDYENGVIYSLQTNAYTSGTPVGRLGQAL